MANRAAIYKSPSPAWPVSVVRAALGRAWAQGPGSNIPTILHPLSPTVYFILVSLRTCLIGGILKSNSFYDRTNSQKVRDQMTFTIHHYCFNMSFGGWRDAMLQLMCLDPSNTTGNRKQIWKAWDTTPILELSGGYRYISCNPVRSINNISGWRLGDIAQPSERSYYRTFLAFTSWTQGTWQGTNWHQQYRQPPDIFQGMAESASKAAQPWRELSV